MTAIQHPLSQSHPNSGKRKMEALKFSTGHSLEPKMGFFSSIWHKFRKKSASKRKLPITTRFPLNRLPYTLKTQIFSSVDHEDLLKFHKISRELRHFITNNGLLPRKIKEIEIQGRNPRTSNGRLIVENRGMIIRRQDTDRAFSRGMEHWSKVDPSITESWVFRKLESCQKLKVILCDDPYYAIDLHLDLLNSLPNRRFLDKFSVSASDFEEISPIFSEFQSKILSEFEVECDQQTEIPATHEFSRFAERNLENCAQIDLFCTRLEMAGAYREAFRLQSTTLRRLRIISRNLEDFLDFTTFLIDNHSRFPDTVIVRLNIPSYRNSIEEIGENFMASLESYKRIEDHKEYEEIFERYSENTIDLRSSDEAITCFWRRIPESDSLVFCVHLRSQCLIRFRAHLLHNR